MREKLVGVLNSVAGFKQALLINAVLCVFVFYSAGMMTAANLLLMGWAAYLLIRGHCRDELSIRALVLSSTLLSLFILINLLSVVLNLPNNFLKNLQMVANLALVFYMGYGLQRESAPENLALFKRLARILVGMTFFLSAVTVALYFLNIHIVHFSGRYCGVYSNPNLSGFAANFSLMATFFLLFDWPNLRRRIRVLYVMQLVLQSIVVMLSNSRSAFICYAVFFIVLLVLLIGNRLRGRWLLRLLTVALISGGILALTTGIFKAAQLATYTANTALHDQLLGDDVRTPKKLQPNDGLSIDEYIFEPDEFSRDETGDQSAHIRWDVIVAGWQTFLTQPVLGVSPGDVVSRVCADHPDTFLGNIQDGGLHNSYLQVLVASGVIGFLCMLTFAVGCVHKFIRGVKAIGSNRTAFRYQSVSMAMLVSMAVFFLFESSMLYAVGLPAVLFWLLLGHMMDMATRPRAYLAQFDPTAVLEAQTHED